MSDVCYALLHGDTVYRDIATCYELEIDPWVDDVDERTKTWVIAEMEAVPYAEFVASGRQLDWAVEHLVESMTEEADDDDGELYERLTKAAGAPDVAAAFRAAFDLLVSKAGDWFIAGNERRQITITHDAGGNPLMDGVPIYRKAVSS
jgi:hypothetical protein